MARRIEEQNVGKCKKFQENVDKNRKLQTIPRKPMRFQEIQKLNQVECIFIDRTNVAKPSPFFSEPFLSQFLLAPFIGDCVPLVMITTSLEFKVLSVPKRAKYSASSCVGKTLNRDSRHFFSIFSASSLSRNTSGPFAIDFQEKKDYYFLFIGEGVVRSTLCVFQKGSPSINHYCESSSSPFPGNRSQIRYRPLGIYSTLINTSKHILTLSQSVEMPAQIKVPGRV